MTHRSAWAVSDGRLPIIEGTVIRLQVQRLPSGAVPKPVWLRHSNVDLDTDAVDRCWQAFLRRFDIEHTSRMLEQALGWNCPKIRDPRAADRWTWLVLAAYTQLRLARDLRSPREKPASPDRLTPARVRRAFRHLRRHTTRPARAPKPTQPGPGRPPGQPNQHPATRHDVHLMSTPDSRTVRREAPKSTTPRPRRMG